MNMQDANSSPENKKYNSEVNFLDGFYEFHPNYFTELTQGERATLKKYYLTGARDIPDNIFEYRLQIIKHQPELEQQAQAAFKKLLGLANIQDFK